MTGGIEHFEGTDRYVIQRCIGRGGFGVVYQAFDRHQNTVVAIKTLHRGGADALLHFKREFRRLADIRHPNLVGLYDLVSDGRQWFFTMELVRGVDFLRYTGYRDAAVEEASTQSIPETRTIVSPESGQAGAGSAEPLPDVRVEFRCDPDRLRAAMRQLAEGICALHRANVVHRDIKPSNVLVTREGNVVILDFGLMADLTAAESGESGNAAGTPAYMAPEQSAGLPAGQAADWYAAGVMLFEALTGRRPFVGSASELIVQKREFDAPAPSDLAAGIPEDLEELCRDLLQRDSRLRPTGIEVLRRLGAQATGASDEPLRAPFTGRKLEFAALQEAVASVRRGRTTVVHIHGTSGIGKSVLVSRFLERVRQSGDAITLAGGCLERESVPYKAFDSLIDQLARYLRQLPSNLLNEVVPREFSRLTRLFPVLKELDFKTDLAFPEIELAERHELRQRGFRALRDLLARVAERATLVLFIDDLQWGDPDSAAVLADLLQPPSPPRVLWIVCYRTEEAGTSPLVQALLNSIQAAGAALRVTELALEGLSQSDSQRLATEIAGGPGRLPAERAEAIARDSAGNPLFIDELVRAADAAIGTATLDQVIHSRVVRLPEPARRLLEVVAVAAQPIGLELAKQAARHEGPDYEMMAALRGGHLVRTRTAGEVQEVEAYHNRIRETVSWHLPAERLRACHGNLAEVLEASHEPDPERLAIHFHGAGDRGKACTYAVAAADQAAGALAFERAARLYRFALEMETGSSAEQRSMRSRLGESLGNAGRGAEAAEVYLLAAGGATEAEALEYRRRASAQLLMSGHLEQGIGVLRDVLAASGMRLASTPWRALLSVLLRRAWIRLRGIGFRERAADQIPSGDIMSIDTCWSVAQGLALVDTIRAADFQMRHLLLALRAGEPYRVSRALAVEAGYHAMRGGRSRARTQSVLRTNRALAERIQHQYPHALGLATMVEGMAAFLEGRWKVARDIHQRAESILRERCRGVAWELATTRLMWSVALFFLGELGTLADRLPVLLKEAEARGDLYEATDLRIRISHANWLAADDPERARREVSEAIAHWPRDEFYIQHWWGLIANVEISLYEGQGQTAWALVTSEWPKLTRSLLMRIQYIRIESLYHRGAAALALAAASSERRQMLLEAAEEDARSIRREKMEWADPLAHVIDAGVAAARGNHGRATDLLRKAEAGFEKAEMALYTAAARRRRGELTGGRDGQILIDAADDWMIQQRVRNPQRMTAMIAATVG